MIIGARVCHFLWRRRLGRTGRAVTAAALAALFAVPATAAVSQASAAAPRAASASCPWVTSRAPVAQRVSLGPGASARVSFVLIPQQESWWDDASDGWTQTAGQYQVYVGDSSALADLPLHGSFTMSATPGARQVTVSAPSVMRPGQAAPVRVTLTAAGTATLPGVRLALQLPQGWRAVPAGPTAFGSVAPGQAVAVRFGVTPPGYAPDASAVVHATATAGGWLREAGANVTVPG